MLENQKNIIKYTIKVIGISAISLFLILILSNVIQLFNIFKSYKEINSSINSIETSINNKDIKEVLSESKKLNTSLKIAKENVENIKFIQILPYIKENITSADDLIDVGIKATNIVISSEDIINDNKTLVDSYKNSTLKLSDPETIQQILSIIDNKKDFISSVKSDLEIIEEKIDQNRSNTMIIGKLKSAWAPIVNNYSKIKLVSDCIPIVQELPDILGFNKNAKYLLLLENNTELRATGGFIGTYGILTVKNGSVENITTDNIYNLDSQSYNRLKIDPPEFLKKYLMINYLYLRDSNYNPDYEISAKYAENLYKKESLDYSNITGVIALTPDVLKDILSIFGNITIDGDKFTPENFVNLLNYETKFGYWDKQIKSTDRKDIIQKITNILLERIKNANKEDYQNIYDAINKNLDEKSLLLYFNNENVQNFIESKNWGGTVNQDTDSDYLSVVDSNLLSGKNDPYVTRDIDYSLNEDDGKLVATLSLSYTFKFVENGIYKDLDQYLNNYKTYTRIYVPKDSWLVSATKDDEKISNADIDFEIENEKTSFGMYLVIPQGQTVTYTFKYYLPNDLSTKLLSNYSLNFQKQPGIAGNNINFNINIGKTIKELTVKQIDNNEIKYKSAQKNININGLNKGDLKITATFLDDNDIQKIIKKVKNDYLSFKKN